MKNAKFLALPVVLMLGLTAVGVSYAHWSESLMVEATIETDELDWEFEPGSVSVRDPCDTESLDPIMTEEGILTSTKNYACGEVILLDGPDSEPEGCPETDLSLLDITLYNAYPGYYNHFDFYVHNNGTTPLIQDVVIIRVDDQIVYELDAGSSGVFRPLDLDGDGCADIMLRWGNNIGGQLDPCQSWNISFGLYVLQEAPECAELNFQVEMHAVNWNEYEQATA